MAEKNPAEKPAAVDIPAKATSLEPGEPVEAVALSQMGGTFAERKKAREKAEGKAVQSAENKSVAPGRAFKK